MEGLLVIINFLLAKKYIKEKRWKDKTYSAMELKDLFYFSVNHDVI